MAHKITFKSEVMFPSEYLCAEELQGRDVTLTIKSVEKHKVKMRDGGDEDKWVLSFETTPKKLILNRKSQPDAIAHMHGLQAENWPGKRITLFPARVLAFGETVDAIRIRETVPGETSNGEAPKTEPATPPTMDDIVAQLGST